MNSEDYSGLIVTQSDCCPDITPSPPNAIWLWIDFVSTGRLARAKKVHSYLCVCAYILYTHTLSRRKDGSLEEGKESVRGVDPLYWQDCFVCVVYVHNHVLCLAAGGFAQPVYSRIDGPYHAGPNLIQCEEINANILLSVSFCVTYFLHFTSVLHLLFSISSCVSAARLFLLSRLSLFHSYSLMTFLFSPCYLFPANLVDRQLGAGHALFLWIQNGEGQDNVLVRRHRKFRLIQIYMKKVQ